MFSNRRDVTSVENWDMASRQLKMQLYPNPADQQFRVMVDMPRSEVLQIEIADAAGRKVHTANYKAAAGVNRFDFHTGRMGLAPGMYVLRVQTASGWSGTTRFIRQ
jgi:hypothetical protein